jgi:hypothetical protein
MKRFSMVGRATVPGIPLGRAPQTPGPPEPRRGRPPDLGACKTCPGMLQ